MLIQVVSSLHNLIPSSDQSSNVRPIMELYFCLRPYSATSPISQEILLGGEIRRSKFHTSFA